MNCGIYRLSTPEGFYIGSSANIKKRIKDHLQALTGCRHYNAKLEAAFAKFQRFDVEVLLICRVEDLIMYEQLYIDHLKPNYNISTKAGRVVLTDDARARMAEEIRRSWTPGKRARMSARMKGSKMSASNKAALLAANLGKRPPEDVRKKIAEANRNRSKATRKKLAAGNKRRVWTPEMRANVSAAMKGKTPWNKGLKRDLGNI